jgi:hypothetical protein
MERGVHADARQPADVPTGREKTSNIAAKGADRVGGRSNSDVQYIVRQKVTEIETATLDRMREFWRAEFGTKPPGVARSFEAFRKLLAWKVQEKYLGGLSRWPTGNLTA